MSLTLQTSETDIAADDVLGKISFQAPDEGTGTDAILVAAAIQAISEGDFSSSSNATSLAFMTGASEAATTKMTLTSAGNLGLGVTSPEALFEIEDGGTSKDILQKITLDNDDVYGLVIGNDSYSTTSADGLAVTVTNAGIVGLQARGTSSQLAFRTVGTERARFTADGTLVIHDTTALANTTFDARDVDNVTSLNVQNNGATIQRSQSATAAPTLVFNKARGSLGSEADVNNGDFTGSITFRGYHGSSFSQTATIESKVSGTPGDSSDMPGTLLFSTSNDGSSTPTSRMEIDQDGVMKLTGGVQSGRQDLLFNNSNVTITNGSSLSLAGILNTGCLIAIGQNRSNLGVTYDHCLLFAETGTAFTTLSDPSGRFAINSATTSNKTNIYVNSNTIVILNEIGSDATYSIAAFVFQGN